MNPTIRFTATLLAAAVVAACTTPAPMTADERSIAAAKQCQVYRGYTPQRDYSMVMEECSRRLGQAYCAACLDETKPIPGMSR